MRFDVFALTPNRDQLLSSHQRQLVRQMRRSWLARIAITGRALRLLRVLRELKREIERVTVGRVILVPHLLRISDRSEDSRVPAPAVSWRIARAASKTID